MRILNLGSVEVVDLVPPRPAVQVTSRQIPQGVAPVDLVDGSHLLASNEPRRNQEENQEDAAQYIAARCEGRHVGALRS
jgi:hypothetical protein